MQFKWKTNSSQKVLGQLDDVRIGRVISACKWCYAGQTYLSMLCALKVHKSNHSLDIMPYHGSPLIMSSL